MPSISIHIRRACTEAEEVAIMNAVHAALVSAFGVKADDTNIILTVHLPHRFRCPPDRDDPQRYLNITVVGHASRPVEAKRRFYTAAVDNLAALGIPRNCSLIQLHELPPEDIAIRGGRPMTDFPHMLVGPPAPLAGQDLLMCVNRHLARLAQHAARCIARALP